MRRLGEMLVERGAISLGELHTGLDACRREGGRLGTRLMNFGFLGEFALLEALAQQHGVPYVSQAMLYGAGLEISAIIPPAVLRRLQVVPFKQLEDRLQVAMSDPSNKEIIEEIKNITKLEVEPFVATERTIAKVLGETRDYNADEGPKVTSVQPQESAALPDSGWSRLWNGWLDQGSLVEIRSRPKPAGTVLLASFPSLVPVGTASEHDSAMIAREKEFVLQLDQVESGNDIGDLLVNFGTQLLDRVCLFSIHRGLLAGWMARGVPFDAANILSFSVSSDCPSLLSELEGVDHFVGPVPAGPVNDQVLRVLGDPIPTEVAIVPVRANQVVKVFLLGDLVGRNIPASTLTELVAAARVAGTALGGLLRKQVGSS